MLAQCNNDLSLEEQHGHSFLAFRFYFFACATNLWKLKKRQWFVESILGFWFLLIMLKKNSEIKTQEKRNLKINLKNLLLNTLDEKNGQFISLYFPFFLSPDGVVLTLATEFVLYTLYFERELNCIATRKTLTKYFKHYWRNFTESLQFDNLG